MKNYLEKIIAWPMLIMIIFLVGSVYVLNIYNSTIKNLEKAKELSNSNEHEKALSLLDNISKKWITRKLGLFKDDIQKQIILTEKLKKDETEYNLGLAYFEKNKLEEAKKMLSSVSKNSKLYKKAQDKLEEVKSEIIISKAVEIMKKDLQEVREIAEDASQSQDISGAIKNWIPVVTPIRCHWSFLNGDITPTTQGSGIIMAAENNTIEILTNRHVITYGNNLPQYCESKIPGVEEILDLSQFKTGYYLSEKEKDWGSINIKEIPQNSYKNAQTIVNRFDPMNNVCKQRLREGSSIAILGYPKIGLKNDVTITTGIISGYENNFYITDAEISEGNSGGAAISVKNNCLIGIPTSVKRNETNSLGKIKDINTIIDD